MLTKNQNNRLTMFKAVATLLERNIALIELFIALMASLFSLKERIRSIESKAEQKDAASSGKAADKLDREDELISILVNLSGKFFAFAKKSKNNELIEIADVTANKLRKLRDVELRSKANIIYEKLKDNLVALSDYNVTQEKFDILKERIDSFNEAIGERLSGKAESLSAGKSVGVIVKETLEFLDDEMDKLMEEYNKDDTREFFNSYKSARVIYDAGIRHREQSEQKPLPPTAKVVKISYAK